jgi:hypothetical protein
MILGRKCIALKCGKEEVELNVVSDINHSYSKEIPKKATNKDPKKPSEKTDQTGDVERVITLQVVLSSTTDILALSTKSPREKLNQLVTWQNTGATIALLGYGTGGLLSKILEQLPEVLQYRPTPIDEKFLGTAFDEISNLQIKDLNFQETVDIGKDFAVNLTLVPQVKIPETPALPGVKKISTQGKTPAKQATKPEPTTTSTTAPLKKSILKSLF